VGRAWSDGAAGLVGAGEARDAERVTGAVTRAVADPDHTRRLRTLAASRRRVWRHRLDACAAVWWKAISPMSTSTSPQLRTRS